MIVNVYGLFDCKTMFYHAPFVAHGNGDAVRVITSLVMGGQHPCSKFPEDFTLFCIGSFDDSKGGLVGFKENELVCSCLDIVNDIRNKSKEIENG